MTRFVFLYNVVMLMPYLLFTDHSLKHCCFASIRMLEKMRFSLYGLPLLPMLATTLASEHPFLLRPLQHQGQLHFF